MVSRTVVQDPTDDAKYKWRLSMLCGCRKRAPTPGKGGRRSLVGGSERV
jgi:hypothetical protein